MGKKTCVLLVQLGTPDSPSKRDVKRYLSEFLNDPRVIDLPAYKRKPLVNGIIVPFRTKNSAQIYQELWDMSEGKSPLLVHTLALQEKLQGRLADSAEVRIAMRYGSNGMDTVFEGIRKDGFEKIVILPLYPHYAAASTGTVMEKAMKIMSKWWVIPEVSIISQFYDDEKYLEAVLDSCKEYNWKDYDDVIFSYHGLPERQVDKVYADNKCSNHSCESEINDENKFCYKATCYATTRLVAEKLGMKESDYTVSFQSRLNDKWLAPFSDKIVEEMGKAGKKKILVFSLAFVADCLETLVEIGAEYQEIFEEHGGEKVQLVPSLNSNEKWVDCVEHLVRQRI
jgi:ferrochelatase